MTKVYLWPAADISQRSVLGIEPEECSVWLALALIAVIVAQLALGFSSFMLFGMTPDGHPLAESGILTPLMLFIVVATFTPLLISIWPFRIGWRRRLVIAVVAFVSLAAIAGSVYLSIAS